MPYPPPPRERRSGAAADGDIRDGFARDRDRLFYSSAFRRLSWKSQVVASSELGSFHTRLTHSIKVAQLGRTLARNIGRSTGTPDDVADPDLVEFACLAHDLGHPPFGHAGEEALQKALARHVGVRTEDNAAARAAADHDTQLCSFEGNPQSHRIVTRLAHKWLPSDGSSDSITEWLGLDLTAASIDSISKYPWERTTSVDTKWGVYGHQGSAAAPGDTDALCWARERTGAEVVLGRDASKSFEAQLMEWCDDVAYAVHDVEDFYQAGLIPLRELLYDEATTEEWERFRDGVLEKWSQRGRLMTISGAEITADYLDESRLSLLGAAYTASSVGIFRGSHRERRLAHKRTSSLISHFVRDVSYQGTPRLHEGQFVIATDPDRADMLRVECGILKELIWTYVITSPALATQQEGHRRVMLDLMDALCGPNGEGLLPTHLRESLEDRLPAVGYSEESLAHLRVACDYVSSLTELEALALHRRIMGIDPGSLRDLS